MLICAEQASCCQFSGDYYGRVESLKNFHCFEQDALVCLQA